MRCSRLSLLATVLVLSACVSAAPPQQELTRLKGQTVQSIIAKLGPADSQQPGPGGTIYVWTTEAQVNMPEKRTTMEYSTGRPNPVETTVFVMKNQPCTLRVTADAAGVISAAEKDGVYAACGALATKLSS